MPLPPSLGKWWDDLQAAILEAVHGSTKGIEAVWGDLRHALALIASEVTKSPERVAAEVLRKIGGSVGLAVPNMLSLIGAALGGAESLVAAYLASAASTDDLAHSLVGAVKGEQEGAGDWLIGVLSHIVRSNLGEAAKSLGDRPIDAPPPMVGGGESGEHLGAELPIAAGPTFDPSSLLNPAARTLGLAFGIIEGALAVGHPGADAIEQLSWELNPVRLPGEDAVISGEVRGFLDPKAAATLAKRSGHDSAAHSLLRELARTRPDVGTLFTAYFRGHVDGDELERGLLRLGLDPRARSITQVAAQSIADPATVLRLVDRMLTASEPEDLVGGEPEVMELVRGELQRHGFEPDEADRLWRAHYRAVDPMTAAELIHRGQLAPEAYGQVLRMNGIPPALRAPLEGILYVPYSRRDLLRLVKLDLIDRPGLVRAVMDLGYDRAKAETLATMFERLAEGDKKSEQDRLRNKHRDIFLALLESGRIDETTCTTQLIALGIDPDEAEADVSLAQLRAHVKELETVAKLIRPFYVSGVWDFVRTGAELVERGVAGTMAQTLFREWDLEREYAQLKPSQHKSRDLTESELSDAFIGRSMPEPAYRAHLSELGFDPEEVATLVTLALIRQHKEDLRDAEAVLAHKVSVGQISEGDASAALDKLGVRPGARDRLLDAWFKQKAQRHSELTFGQISDLAKAELIDEETADELLHRLPYADEERALLLALLGYKVAQQQVKAQQAAEKEARRATTTPGGAKR